MRSFWGDFPKKAPAQTFETLEHIIDHMKSLNEISRILKPGGVLVISTPDRVPYNEMNGSPNPYHLKELDRAEFKLLLMLFARVSKGIRVLEFDETPVVDEKGLPLVIFTYFGMRVALASRYH